MLAAHHEQENVYTHQAGASKQQLQAKTPGARFPKTPLKVSLNDENANQGLGGKSALRTKGNNENITTVGKGGKSGRAMMTPGEPRTGRAPLGNKTTNAKARTTQQTVGVKDIVREFEKTTLKPTTTVRPKQAAPQVESSKLEVHTDRNPLDDEEDIEYAPPRQKETPYESDVFPDGGLTFEGLKKENLFRGYYDYYFNQIDENGMSATEREMEERRQRDFKRGDEQIMRDMEEFDWSVGDVPASKDLFKVKRDPMEPAASVDSRKTTRLVPKAPNTINSRKAAAALAMSNKPVNTAHVKPARPAIATKGKVQSFLLPRQKPAQAPAQPTLAQCDRVTAVVASRSTLGYSKGRSALSAATRQPEPPVRKPRALTRTASTTSTASSGSDSTITPARFAQTQASKDLKKPQFVSIFDVDEEDNAHISGIPEPQDLDDDFQLSTDF
ncbi:hypothetical protein QBC34DRAFT_318700 [Podospora aff. communis PSN243]|uniref:Uncharacterized protein n=1 Tax=Podospora aff. communis PSN243 TaxID=3040156 RepID=A0AAV9H191_9PEZI|nr:hypothetical protein QBC34DRAFT_318700 [Podospora aff. communis PSN243]